MSSDRDRSKPFVRPAELRDVCELSMSIRQADREEVWHCSRSHPFTALLRGFEASEDCLAVEWNGRTVALFGVVRTDSGGSPWMLGSDDIGRCFSIHRECRQFIHGYAEKYGYLTNAVWSRNEVHVKWIKWLGFIFKGSTVVNGETFLHFHRSRNV